MSTKSVHSPLERTIKNKCKVFLFVLDTKNEQTFNVELSLLY